MGEQEPFLTKLRAFCESPITWGGIGVIAGALGLALSLKILFVIGGLPIAIAIILQKFFQRWNWLYAVLGNTALCLSLAAALYGVWRLVPKPKECPTVADIADAVQRKLSEAHDNNTQSVTPFSPPVIAENKKPQTKLKTPKKPAASIASAGSEPPLQAHLSITQTRRISTRTDAPTETEVVVQTDKVFPSLKFVMECDKPLVDAQPTVGGANGVAQMMVSSGIVRDHPNVVVYSYGSSVPPFGPANPLIIYVWSKEPVTCNQAATF
jgi:hypothetical protein